MLYAISHRTAAFATHVPAVRKALCSFESPISLPNSFSPSLDGETACNLSSFLSIDEKLCGLSSPGQSRLHKCGGFTQTIQKGIPKDSFIKLGKSLYMPCPEYLFLQMARELDFVNLIRFGYDLCGTYSPGHNEIKTAYGLQPLTTVEAISSYLQTCNNTLGVQASLAALKYVENGSASPRESIIATIFKLPFSKGGFAQGDFQMNAQYNKSRDTRFPDLYFPQYGIDVEYDSDEFHDDRTRDAIRRNQLLASDLRTLNITTEMLDSLDMMRGVLEDFYNMAGRRLQARLRNYETKRIALQSQLLAPEWYKLPPQGRYSLEQKG